MGFPGTYRELLLQALSSVDLDRVQQAIEWFHDAREQGSAIFVAGNGGSSATATHLVCDLVKDASFGREQRFRALTLHDSMPTMTAYSNDVSYLDAMAEQLRNFAQPGDLYMAISGSGNSENLVRAMQVANDMGCRTLSLTGRDGGRLGAMAHLDIRVAEPHMGRIQDAHHMICHMICYSFVENAQPLTNSRQNGARRHS
jgi:D-sedoheptulose 7-phosphate isomerase